MTNQQQQQAQTLYFQTDLTKSQIAELLSTDRSSLHCFIRERNWARLKKSAGQLPGLLAENCYHIISHFTESLLSEFRINRPVTRHEADTLHKLTLTIGKLKTHSTLNESMEMFAYFMEDVQKKAPHLTDELKPIIEDFISSRASVHKAQLMPENFNSRGFIPADEPTTEEDKLDLQDIMEWTDSSPRLTPDEPATEIASSENEDTWSPPARRPRRPLMEAELKLADKIQENVTKYWAGLEGIDGPYNGPITAEHVAGYYQHLKDTGTPDPLSADTEALLEQLPDYI